MVCQACAASEKHGPCGSDVLHWVEALVRTERARLVRLARFEGAHGDDALDCVQECFHALLQRPDVPRLMHAPVEESAKLLSTLVRNLARNRRRRHAVARPHDDGALGGIVDDAPSSEELLTQGEELMRLRGCVATLGDMQRTVITLRMLEERPGEDVAEILGVTRNHVGVLLHRAKAELRACMVR